MRAPSSPLSRRPLRRHPSRSPCRAHGDGRSAYMPGNHVAPCDIPNAHPRGAVRPFSTVPLLSVSKQRSKCQVFLHVHIIFAKHRFGARTNRCHCRTLFSESANHNCLVSLAQGALNKRCKTALCCVYPDRQGVSFASVWRECYPVLRLAFPCRQVRCLPGWRPRLGSLCSIVPHGRSLCRRSEQKR